MLKYRLLVGFPMAAAALGLLLLDTGRDHPGLFVLVMLVAVASVRELRYLIVPAVRPRVWLTTLGVLTVLVANWTQAPSVFKPVAPSPWPAVLLTLTALMLVAATREVLAYAGDGTSTGRLIGTVFALVYLGVLPSFLVQLVWLPVAGPWAVLATIFVPKVCDIGAYFTGRAFGRHPMAPTLSPKKTWEGFAGGLVASAGTAVGIGYAAPLFPHGPLEAAAFGVVVGTVGVLGDLFESLLKRDAQVKDASAAIPGYGGVLDVIDSILFAAPVAYLWFSL